MDTRFDLGVSASELLRDAPCGIAVTDRYGKILFLNAEMAKWVGVQPEDLPAGQRLPDFLTKPGRIYFETHISPMLHLQGFVREISCYLTRPGGGVMPVLLNALARTNAFGQVERVDYTLFDATERTSYEAELRSARRESEQLAMIVRRSPHTILRLDQNGAVQSWNRGAQRMLGVPEAEAIGRYAEPLVGLRDRDGWLREAMHRCDVGTEFDFDAMLRSGQAVDVTLARLDDRLTPGGKATYSLVLRDVTRRKRAEDRLNLIVGELNHRVKNILGVVTAIARQTLKGEERGAFTSRLQALSTAHDLITRANDQVVDLRHLLEVSVAHAAGEGRSVLEGPKVGLHASSVPSMSMVLHELMTNAMKYGALSGPEGGVELRWRVEDPGKVHLEWREIGGPPARPPERQGFGSRMIETVIKGEFGGTVDLDFAPGGLRCLMVLNLPSAEDAA